MRMQIFHMDKLADEGGKRVDIMQRFQVPLDLFINCFYCLKSNVIMEPVWCMKKEFSKMTLLSAGVIKKVTGDHLQCDFRIKVRNL